MKGYEDLGPGLHKVGPKPYDYVFNPSVGQRVIFVGPDGREFRGAISDYIEDDDTGELTLAMEAL